MLLTEQYLAGLHTRGDPAAWLAAQRNRFGSDMTLSIGGPRESEAPGIYALARMLIAAILDSAP